jgi:hypothetical protein
MYRIFFSCANLCFSHPVSGIAQIPLEFWKKVQENENSGEKFN